MAISAALLHGEPSAFSGGFELHPSVVIGCLALVGSYLWVIGAGRVRHGWSDRPVERWRIASWMTAVVLVFLSLNGPLHELSDYFLFSAHMTQHILLMMVMPPLLVLGLPPGFVRWAVRADRRVLKVGRLLTHPVAAFVAYNLVFLGWHFPGAYNAALENHQLHIVQHLMFIAVATMMWWPVIAPAPELERIPDGPLLMLYVFAFGIPTTILSAFITMSESLFYGFYGEAARVSSLSAMEDQRLGGLLMWIPGMLIFWTAITGIWLRWTREEYVEWRQEAREAAAAAARP